MSSRVASLSRGSVVLLLVLARGAGADLLLDERLTSEIAGASTSTVLVEGVAVPAEFALEQLGFWTCIPRQLVAINISAPLTVHGDAVVPGNGTVRVYLDRVDTFIRQVAAPHAVVETLIGNAGQWQVPGRAMNGRLSVVHYLHVEEPGPHVLLVRGATSGPETIVTLRGMRLYQILDVHRGCG